MSQPSPTTTSTSTSTSKANARTTDSSGQLRTYVMAARALGCSWREIEANLKQLGYEMSYESLRRKFHLASSASGTLQPAAITRDDICVSLIPLIERRRHEGCSWKNIDLELKASGVAIPFSYLRVFITSKNMETSEHE